MKKRTREKENTRVKATIVLEKNLWREFRKRAIDEDLKVSELFEKVIRLYTKK